jgi:hypothetical protein
VASGQWQVQIEETNNSMNSMGSTNSSNPTNKVLLLCRAEVLQLNYLTAAPKNRSTAALQHRSTIKHWFLRLTNRKSGAMR